jgi:hypothetical protein
MFGGDGRLADMFSDAAATFDDWRNELVFDVRRRWPAARG